MCEAIDFLEYYARGAIELEAGRELLQVPGERNELRYRPPRGRRRDLSLELPARDSLRDDGRRARHRQRRGAQARRAVAGMRPAAGARRCAPAAFLRPRSRCCPARATSARRSSRDPGVHTIAFTGSLPVGLEIVRAAADIAPGQHHLKRVVAELGGKNCVIVDADADLDEAVPAIVSSAFVYAGQKCSAAARVLVHEAIAEQLLERVAGAVPVLVVGQASELATEVPPVIERAAQERVRALRASWPSATAGSSRAVEPVPERGWFCPPTVAADLAAGSPVLEEEIFGPLLAIERVRDVEHGLRHRRRPPVRADRRAVRARSGDRPLRARAQPRSATCTSTAGSPARWSAASRSAATGCRAPGRRPAARTTCCSSSSPAR